MRKFTYKEMEQQIIKILEEKDKAKDSALNSPVQEVAGSVYSPDMQDLERNGQSNNIGNIDNFFEDINQTPRFGNGAGSEFKYQGNQRRINPLKKVERLPVNSSE